MALWTNTDDENGKPKYLSTADKAKTYGVSEDEASAQAGITHAGWVLRTEGTGGRAGRVQFETLVAMGSMTGDAADDAIFADRAITISGQPQNASVADGDSVTFTVVATSAPAGTLTYAWEVSTDSGSTWTATGTNSAELTFTAAAADDGSQYRVTVSAGNAADVTSTAATLTVA